MAKSQKSAQPKPAAAGDSERDVGKCFVDRKLLPIKTAEQFVPTPAEPLRMRYKMAGGC